MAKLIRTPTRRRVPKVLAERHDLGVNWSVDGDHQSLWLSAWGEKMKYRYDLTMSKKEAKKLRDELTEALTEMDDV